MLDTKSREPDFKYDRQAETMSRPEIAELQAERLRWSLRHAYENVAHFRAAFDKAGVTPDDLKTAADIRHFPFTVKTDLRDNYPFNMFSMPLEKMSRVHASSGTTGKPTVVGYSKKGSGALEFADGAFDGRGWV